MSAKSKLRLFFQATSGSEFAVELLENFILPFARGMKKSGVDDVLNAFFGVDQRMFAYLKAKRGFNLPGKYFIAGDRPVLGAGPAGRKIKKGQVLLVAIDKEQGTARVEVGSAKDPHVYLLEQYEFESIKDWLDVVK